MRLAVSPVIGCSASNSARDWSDPGESKLHISAVDSILLQFRRSRERVKRRRTATVQQRISFEGDGDFVGTIARCASSHSPPRDRKRLIAYFLGTKGSSTTKPEEVGKRSNAVAILSFTVPLFWFASKTM